MLTKEQRLKSVLRSQGITRRAEIESLPESVKSGLAELCGDDGQLVADARVKAEAILDAYYDAQKATVDKTRKATPEVK